MEEKIIGIVGGVGPYAGIDLQTKIAQQTVAQTDQDHLTVISISQPNQILDRTEFLLGNVATNPGIAIAEQIIKLGRMGADVVGIPCNTAHAPEIFDVVCARLQEANCSVDLLHMIRETAVYIQTEHPEVKTVGVLSTTGTYKTQIYPQILQPMGFKTVVPEVDMQDSLIHPAIYDLAYGIKANGFTDRARTNMLVGIEVLQQKGAQAIILGCTEIPIVISAAKIGPTICVDPTKILARSLIRIANSSELR